MSQIAQQSRNLLSCGVFEAYPDTRNHMYPFTDNEISELALIFDVHEDRVAVDTHPLDFSQFALSAQYGGRVNADAAVSSYLNRDFYNNVPECIATKVQFTPNGFSYVSRKNGNRMLYLSFHQYDKLPFMSKLRQHAGNIQYILQHTDILFLRPQLDFKTAKAHLDAGFKVTPQPV
jgi:hypothetical protein